MKLFQMTKDKKDIQNNKIIKGLRFERDAPKNFGQEISASKDKTTDLYIYDVIGWPYIEAQDVINAVPEDMEEINIHINSPGGSVFEGIAIFNFLKTHKAKKNVFVDGLAASMGSILAMVGDEITIYDNAFFMIHDPWVMISGNAEELIKEAEFLRKIETTMAGIYAEKTGLEEAEILELMHAETWFTGEEAKEKGFAGVVVTAPEQNSTNFDLSLFENAPQRQGVAAKIKDKKEKTEDEMNKKLRAMLEAMGLSKDATEDEAWEFFAKNKVDEKKEETANIDIEAEKVKAREEEKKRQADIRHYVNAAGLDDAFAQKLIDEDVSAEDAGKKIFDELAKDNKPVGSSRIETGTSEGEKFKAAAVDGLLMRAGKHIEKPAPGAENLRGYEISAIIKESLHRSGVDVSGLHSRRAVADFITSPKALSTSDYPGIFKDVINKTLMDAYNEYSATWKPFTNITTASDFKTQYGIALSEAPDLELVNEHGEYKHGSFKENQESYRVYKYGKIIELSWEMIVNDDLRAFTRIPQLLGNAARRKESDLVYSLITSNPTMNDGKALFHADHKNLVASAEGAVVSSSTLEAGRLAMRKQKGLNGAHIDLRPRFLLVPVAQETTAEVILRSRGSLDSEKNAGVINPWYNSLTPIADPRLDDNSAVSWYLIADPRQADTIEAAYLDGYEQPTVSENAEFVRDAIGWKIRHCFGCGVMDHRSFYKNQKN
jgi:ATP-dependent Clp endopeptidase proteolytic subunit ClpP